MRKSDPALQGPFSKILQNLEFGGPVTFAVTHRGQERTVWSGTLCSRQAVDSLLSAIEALRLGFVLAGGDDPVLSSLPACHNYGKLITRLGSIRASLPE